MSTNPGRELQSSGWNFVKVTHSDPYPLIDPKQLDLKGKNVFITGTSRGIGVELVKSFAEAGASNIAVAARGDNSSTVKAALEAASQAGRPAPTILDLKVDVSNRQNIEAAAQKVQQAFGYLDIVVNNAGVLEKYTPLLDSDPDVWWKTWEINVRGTYLVARTFVPLLLKSPNSLKILNLYSSIGANVLIPGGSGYMASKLAVLRLAEFLQFEYRDQGLLTYCYHPGAVPTTMADGMPEELTKTFHDSPKLAADTTAYLSSERHEWLAARYISANWDMAELFSKKEEIIKYDLLKTRLVVEGI